MKRRTQLHIHQQARMECMYLLMHKLAEVDAQIKSATLTRFPSFSYEDLLASPYAVCPSLNPSGVNACEPNSHDSNALATLAEN